MSGGILGSGNAWSKNHKGILDHAQNLHYDHYLESIGKSLPTAVDSNDYTQAEKETWISAMDDFNAWKKTQVPLQESGKAWWQTYPAANSGSGEESGGGSSSSGYGGSGWGSQLTGNIYHPQLVQEYSRPNMVPVEGLLDPRNPLSYIGDGALYQPGTVQSAAFAPDGIVGYQPPELSVGMPRMVGNPYGSLELPEGWEELLSGFEEEEEEESTDDDPKGFE